MRVFLQYFLPLALPTLGYLAWTWYARRRGKGGDKPLADGPWVWLVLAGVGLMLAGLVFLALTSGADPDRGYQPPVYKGGKVVPGQAK